MTSTPGNEVSASGCSQWEEPAFSGPGWTRKTLALLTHLGCLALFWFLVVWPVVSPVARGELAREFEPVRKAWSDWTS